MKMVMSERNENGNQIRHTRSKSFEHSIHIFDISSYTSHMYLWMEKLMKEQIDAEKKAKTFLFSQAKTKKQQGKHQFNQFYELFVRPIYVSVQTSFLLIFITIDTSISSDGEEKVGSKQVKLNRLHVQTHPSVNPSIDV